MKLGRLGREKHPSDQDIGSLHKGGDGEGGGSGGLVDFVTIFINFSHIHTQSPDMVQAYT